MLLHSWLCALLWSCFVEFDGFPGSTGMCCGFTDLLSKQSHGLYFPEESFSSIIPWEKRARFGYWIGSSRFVHPAFTEGRYLDDVDIAVRFEFENVDDVWKGELHALISLWL